MTHPDPRLSEAEAQRIEKLEVAILAGILDIPQIDELSMIAQATFGVQAARVIRAQLAKADAASTPPDAGKVMGSEWVMVPRALPAAMLKEATSHWISADGNAPDKWLPGAWADILAAAPSSDQIAALGAGRE